VLRVACKPSRKLRWFEPNTRHTLEIRPLTSTYAGQGPILWGLGCLTESGGIWGKLTRLGKYAAKFPAMIHKV